MISLENLPLGSIHVNSPYGARSITVNGKYYWWHNGVDLKAQYNTPINVYPKDPQGTRQLHQYKYRVW